jgi:hypothetical protein
MKAKVVYAWGVSELLIFKTNPRVIMSKRVGIPPGTVVLAKQ